MNSLASEAKLEKNSLAGERNSVLFPSGPIFGTEFQKAIFALDSVPLTSSIQLGLTLRQRNINYMGNTSLTNRSISLFLDGEKFLVWATDRN